MKNIECIKNKHILKNSCANRKINKQATSKLKKIKDGSNDGLEIEKIIKLCK